MINLASTLAAITIAIGTMIMPGNHLSKNIKMEKGHDIATLTITSPAFEPGTMIPDKYTCKGANINPPIHIEGIPEGTKSMALILDDPDAPVANGFNHWVMWNIDQTMPDIPEAYHGAVQGFNSNHKKGYIGPCPPQGTHHYHFKVYCLNSLINLPPDSYKDKLEKAIKGRVIAQGELIGLFTKMK